jgi:hypothetical protein
MSKLYILKKYAKRFMNTSKNVTKCEDEILLPEDPDRHVTSKRKKIIVRIPLE